MILQEFFVERAFRIFDKDGSGTVSLAEFIETMHQFSGQGEDEKISFLFKVYDLNGKNPHIKHEQYKTRSKKGSINAIDYYAEIVLQIIEIFLALLRGMLNCVPKKQEGNWFL